MSKSRLTPPASSKQVRSVMQSNRGRDSKLEMRLRREIHSKGLRYAIDRRPEEDVNSRADLLFESAKLVVYVNGCFWHGCGRHYREPKTNASFWRNKIATNRTRDRKVRRNLQRRGWKVIVVWEHDDVEQTADEISKLVRQRRALNRKEQTTRCRKLP
jgi:DNA mismatch endonuclease (patch repair protein)